MNDAHADSASIRELCEMFEAKARAEIAEADALAPGSDVVAWSGVPVAHVALVKGLPGPAEASGGAALSGPDGPAAVKALTALGWPDGTWFATLSRPDAAIDAERLVARLRLLLEAVDPIAIIALDGVAAQDVADALGCERLTPGKATMVAGRQVVVVDAFEASLSDEGRKRTAWEQFRSAKPPGPVY